MKTALIIGGVCIAALITLHHQLYYHFRAVDKGKLYRCGKLSRAALWLVCKHYNIKTVINLMRQDELGRQWYDAQKSFCEQAGIGYFCVPFSAPPPARPARMNTPGRFDNCSTSWMSAPTIRF